MSSFLGELLNTVELVATGGILDRTNQDIRTQQANALAHRAQQVLEAGSPIIETQKQDNCILLQAGAFGGFKAALQGTLIVGAPGSTITGSVALTGQSCTLRNLHIVGPITIGATSVVILEGCVLEALPSQAGDFITMDAGGKLLATGNRFIGGQSKAFVVNNAGAATNAQLVGNANQTGKSHQNVTSLGELI